MNEFIHAKCLALILVPTTCFVLAVISLSSYPVLTSSCVTGLRLASLWSLWLWCWGPPCTPASQSLAQWRSNGNRPLKYICSGKNFWLSSHTVINVDPGLLSLLVGGQEVLSCGKSLSLPPTANALLHPTPHQLPTGQILTALDGRGG